MPRLLRACRMHVLMSAFGALHLAEDESWWQTLSRAALPHRRHGRKHLRKAALLVESITLCTIEHRPTAP